jgi:sortase A
LASDSRSNVPASTSCWQRWSYSSAEPSHQWTSSGWASSATWSTQASSLSWVVGAVVACVTAGTLYLVPARPFHTLISVRPVLRFVASVMMVSGTLLIADAGVTLLWQEPVSAFVANREQGELKKAFFDPPRRVIRRQPLKGDAIARIELPSIGVSEYVVEGTDTASLRKGPGHYPETPLPGDPGTTAIAGHRTTYGAPFRKIDQLRRGEPVTIDMPDGRFIYRVERTKIVDDQDLSVLDEVGRQRLVLSACHPLYSAAQRVVVFARFLRREPPRVRRS